MYIAAKVVALSPLSLSFPKDGLKKDHLDDFYFNRQLAKNYEAVNEYIVVFFRLTMMRIMLNKSQKQNLNNF